MSEFPTLTDQNESPLITDARKKLSEFLDKDLTPEQLARTLHTVVLATDLKGFNLNVKGVRTIIERLKALGFTGPDRFTNFQENRQMGEYSPEDSLNSFRSHCEILLQKRYKDSPDETPFALSRSEIILEFKSAAPDQPPVRQVSHDQT